MKHLHLALEVDKSNKCTIIWGKSSFVNHFGTEIPALNPLFLHSQEDWEAETDEKSSFAESSGENLLDTDWLSNQTRSGNADGSSCESGTAQDCDPDDVDALELFCKPPSYYYEDGYI